MLFKDYKSIEYVLNKKSITLVDIFKNVTFIGIENNIAFLDYFIQDGETPETVAIKFYGDSSLSWLILLSNNIADIQNDWFSDSTTYFNKFERDYGGIAAYIGALPKLEQGDLMVKVTAHNGTNATTIDTSTYLSLSSFDPQFRVARGITGSGTFANGDSVIFARQNPEDGTISRISFGNTAAQSGITDFTTMYYAEPYSKTIDYLYDGNNVIRDPYQYHSDPSIRVNVDTIYSNPSDNTTVHNFAKTTLYHYITNKGGLYDGISKEPIENLVQKSYYNKQRIKVLNPNYVPIVVSEIKGMINQDIVGRILRIKL